MLNNGRTYLFFEGQAISSSTLHPPLENLAIFENVNRD